MSDVTYRPYRPGDESAINDGFNRVFGLSRSMAEWHWKYALETTRPWIMLALDGEERVLASYSAIVVPMRLGGGEINVGQPVDVYSVPEVRGTKVFTACYEEFCSRFGGSHDLPLIYGFPGGRHYVMGMKLLNYELIRSVGYWRRPARKPRVRLPLVGPRVRRGFDAGSVDDLWRRASHRYPYATVRDGRWFSRRFTGRASVGYDHLAVVAWGAVRAWGVATASGDTLRLADLVWDGESAGSLAALDAELDALAARRGCVQVETWLSGDAEAERKLEALGWARSPEPSDLHMVIRSFDSRIGAREMTERFYLTMGDADLV